MSAYNVVRFRVKPGKEQEFIELHRKARQSYPGMVRLSLIRTGDRTFCLVGEWGKMQDIANARPDMIKTLDSLRPLLEDLGGGLGVTDPVSGEAVVELKP